VLSTFYADQVLLPDTGYGFALLYNGYSALTDTASLRNGVAALITGTTPPAAPIPRVRFVAVLSACLTLGTLTLGARALLRLKAWTARLRPSVPTAATRRIVDGATCNWSGSHTDGRTTHDRTSVHAHAAGPVNARPRHLARGRRHRGDSPGGPTRGHPTEVRCVIEPHLPSHAASPGRGDAAWGYGPGVGSPSCVVSGLFDRVNRGWADAAGTVDGLVHHMWTISLPLCGRGLASALAMKNHRVEVGDTPSSVRDLWAGMVHS
jgi:hypothetical protein